MKTLHRMVLVLLAVAGLVVVTPAFGDNARAVTKRVVRALERLEIADIQWGEESEGKGLVGVIEPAYFTPDPDRVEVLSFVNYTYSTSRFAYRHLEAWAKTLPGNVDVRVLVFRPLFPNPTDWDERWKQHQRVFYAASMFKKDEEVHRAMLSWLEREGGFALDTIGGAEKFFVDFGLDRGAFRQWGNDNRVKARMSWSTRASLIMGDVLRNITGLKGNSTTAPFILVDGQYVVGTRLTKDPGKTFRIANSLIRRAMESKRDDGGPTDNVEFAEWMSAREGEVFHEVINERLVSPHRYVYSDMRRELWLLDEVGAVEASFRLTGEGEGAYFLPATTETWRRGRLFVSFEGENGPQRYGAFLLTDWLSSPDTHWVGMPWKGGEAALAFLADGKVEARNERGRVFGSWWLEAGDLHVSLADLGSASWPWREVAKHVGLKVPQESLTPWKE